MSVLRAQSSQSSSRKARNPLASSNSPSQTYSRRIEGDGEAIDGFAMMDAIENRRRAESDLQLIANRIALLRFEEQRAAEKIAEIKNRAEEVVKVKKIHEDKLQSRLAYHMAKEKARRDANDRARAEREERKQKLLMSRKALEDSKRAIVIERKILSHHLSTQAQGEKVQIDSAKKRKALEEKRRKESLRLQKEKQELEMDLQRQQEYVIKMDEERKRRLEAENIISLLENEEKELVEKLKHTQRLQQQVHVKYTPCILQIFSMVSRTLSDFLGLQITTELFGDVITPNRTILKYLYECSDQNAT